MLASISFDTNNGFLYIAGDSGANTGQAFQLNSSLVRATVDNITQDVPSGAITRIVFIGYAGNDQFINNTAIDGLLLGNDGDDTLTGGSGFDQISGGSGDDVLVGRAGNDRIFGLAGSDIIHGGDGDDFITTGDSYNEAYGEAGNDTIFGGDDVDRLDGGDGADQLYGGNGNDLLFSGDGGVAGSPGVTNADLLMGSNGNDTFTGGAGLNVFYGGDGNDVMLGGDGENRMHGQNGNDSLTGGISNDYLAGNNGDDTIEGLGGFDFILPGFGNDTVNAGSANDFIAFGGAFASFQILGSGSSLSVIDTRSPTNGTDTITNAETFRFSDGDREAKSPIDKRVVIQPIIVSNSNGSNTAEFMGNASQEVQIMQLIDLIYYQAGIDIEWLSERTWNNTFANVGNGGSRPGSDLDSVITSGDNAGRGNSNPLVIDMYFVEIAAGFGNTTENTANGLAFVNANGITVHVGDNLPGFSGGREVVARVIAHEIAHNLGLEHVVDPVNLMDDGDQLTSSQISTVRASQFSTTI